MSVGIAAWGRYLPRRTAIKRPDAGAVPRTAAAWDEDSFTMGLEAARRCLDMYAAGSGPAVEILFVVRAGERHEAGDRSLLVALGLPDHVQVVALPPGADGPADALDLALSGVEYGQFTAALVIGASCAAGEGDGAAALVVNAEPRVQLEARAEVNLAFLWAGGPDGKLVPSRYEQQEVIAPGLRSAIDAALAGAGRPAADVEAWALSSAWGYAAARGLGRRRSPLAGDQAFSYAPGADVVLRLVVLCGAAQRGRPVLAVNVGERVWASVWCSRAEPPESPGDPPRAQALDYAAQTRELAGRELAAGRNVDAMDYVREASLVLRGQDVRCASCGRITVRSRTTSGTASEDERCGACGGPAERVTLAREATVRAFTRSHLTPAEQATPTTYLVCDIDGGGRLMSEIAGGEDGEVKIGSRVTLTLRRGYRDHGRSLYFWKAVPRG